MNKVVTIAGMDPSAGAGLLADIKTFESHGIYGMVVCTAITVQNEDEFESCTWSGKEDILNQINTIYKLHNIDWVKIGLVQDLTTLELIVDKLVLLNPHVNIIWDPIMKASAGFTFHQYFESSHLEPLLKKLFLITPNLEEMRALAPELDQMQALASMSKLCNVLLTGGHGTGSSSNDLLAMDGDVIEIPGERFLGYDKHGTGCVLSSAILANLADGNDLETSCRKAKEYTSAFILSSDTKLGYHKQMVL